MTLYRDWQQSLQQNVHQFEAFKRRDHTVVIAGPGSGKTLVLALKIAKILRYEVTPPQGIACLTYTRMMARELETRLYALGIADQENVFVGTVHSFCLGLILQPFADLFDLGVPKPLRVAPESVRKSCRLLAMRKQFGDQYDPESNADRERDFVKYRRQRADLPYDLWKDHKEIANAIYLYEEDLLKLGFVDFDIIISKALRLIIDHSLVRQSLRAKFSWIAVDEYQDLGYPLFRIVTELVDHTSIKLLAIGDPDQCIFDFAGTDPKYLLQLSDRQDMQPCITLNHNYRSTQEIINVAQVILGSKRDHKSTQIGGHCRLIECTGGLDHQANVSADLIQDYLASGVEPQEIAVLHRYRKDLEHVAQTLAVRQIEHALDKDPLYDRSMTLIRWLEDLANWCLRGWADRPNQKADFRSSFEDLLRTWLQFGLSNTLRLDGRTNHARIYFAEVLWSLRNPGQLLGNWLGEISSALDLATVLEQYRDTEPDEVEEFQHLSEATRPGGKLSNLPLAKFAHLDASVQLTTIHSSKGTEFEVVIITGVERVYISTSNRRLMYVGATRAKRELCLLYTKFKPSGSKYEVLPDFIKDLKTEGRAHKWPYLSHENVRWPSGLSIR